MTTQEEIQAMIATAIAQFEKEKSALEKPKAEELLTEPQVREMLGCSHSTLWKWAKSSYLPTVKVGGKLRYKRSDVERIMGRA